MEIQKPAVIPPAAPAAFQLRLWRGWLWLAFAIAGALYLTFGGDTEGYVGRWLGAVFKAASGGYVGYRLSRGLSRIDTSTGESGNERGLLHIARALCIIGGMIGVCVAT